MIEQTKTKPQETLEFKSNKQMQTFSFNPPINLFEESKWLLAVSFFECTNSVFNITDKNKSFSITIPELKSRNGIESLVEQVRKKGLILLNDYSLSSLGMFKDEILEELKNAKCNDLEDLIYRFQLTYDEILDLLDLKHSPTKRTGCSLNPDIYEVVDLNNTLKNILPDNVKVNVTIDDVRLKSNIKVIQTSIFTEKSFFYTILSFTRSRFYPLDVIDGFHQFIAGLYEGDRLINITGIDKVHLKCDCINGSIVNGIREPILYSLSLSSPPGRKIYKEPRVKLFKKLNKFVLSHITFYLEDDVHKSNDFNGET